MTAGRRIRIMAGLHVVRKQLKLVDRYYVYAWRGGPCIHSQDERPPVIDHKILAKQQEMKASRYGESKDSFDALIRGYEESAEYGKLAKATKTDNRLWLTRASEQFGWWPISAFEDRRMRADIITWRNCWKDQPRTADKAAGIMSLVLGWAVDNGLLKINVASGIKKLHEVHRADLIWEADHWNQVYKAEMPAHLIEALRVTSWTGLRLSDLVGLDWGHVGPKAVVMTTSKSRGRARVVIPIVSEFRAWLDAIPEDNRFGPVLKNSRGKGWTPSGLESVWQKNKPEGFDRTIHDIRGTFCTTLIMKGLTDDQAAMIMGWTSKRVSAIRARYVDEERVIVGLAERLSA